MRERLRVFFAMLIGGAVVLPGRAQFVENAVEFLTLHPNERAVARDSTIYPAKIVLAPIITYAPETSLGLGVGAKYLFKFRGSGDETRTSNMPISVTYTFNNQFILGSGYEIFFNQERAVLTGNFRYSVFPQFFYGVGRRTPDSNEEEFSYSRLLFEPLLGWQTPINHLFVGGGPRYNQVWGVEFGRDDGILATGGLPGAGGSRAVGLSFAALFDSRDNLLNAYRGWYALFTHGVYGEYIGSNFNFQRTVLDLRTYVRPIERRQDVLAFQFLAQMTWGDVPVVELAALGGSEMMRGYYEGRFRDRSLLAFQMEYRRRITGRLGMVAFAGLGEVSPTIGDFDLGFVEPSVGFGLRFLIERRERLNLRFDWGFGRNTNNYYFQVSESF
ncbi:MAG: BamA/TamA family outer membrane protein [Catalinimonas sp.]